MEDQCDPAEVKRHFDLLLKEVQQISAKKAMALEGKVMEVLAEEQNTQDASLITGRPQTIRWCIFREPGYD